jgi:hypothetical protein
MDRYVLVAMRLVNMIKRHPQQDESHVCVNCCEKVGIYPSGQRAIKRIPNIKIVCEICAFKHEAAHIDFASARTQAEFDRELSESVYINSGNKNV